MAVFGLLRRRTRAYATLECGRGIREWRISVALRCVAALSQSEFTSLHHSPFCCHPTDRPSDIAPEQIRNLWAHRRDSDLAFEGGYEAMNNGWA